MAPTMCAGWSSECLVCVQASGAPQFLGVLAVHGVVGCSGQERSQGCPTGTDEHTCWSFTPLLEHPSLVLTGGQGDGNGERPVGRAQAWGPGAGAEGCHRAPIQSLVAEALSLQGERLHRRQTSAPKMSGERRTPDTETLPSMAQGQGAVRSCWWPPGWPPPSSRPPLPWGRGTLSATGQPCPGAPSHPCGLQHLVSMQFMAGAALLLLCPTALSLCP